MKEFPPRTAIDYNDGLIRFIDQRTLPHRLKIVETDDYRVVARAIKSLAIRGAPLIGVAAALAVSAEARKTAGSSDTRKRIQTAIDLLRLTRPTAVNLFVTLEIMQRTLKSSVGDDLVGLLEHAAISIFEDDRKRCDLIAEAGLPLIPADARIVTICNTGFLATAGIGTALGVITKAADAGRVKEVFALETRPLLQGARLTAWELVQSDIPVTLLADGAAGSLLRRGEIDLAIIGADRIAGNGDTANKIGSLQLALACIRFGVPFYVAAPFTTIDPATSSGSEIEIEARPEAEVTHFSGKEIAASGAKVYNPAFDLVDAELITVFITDRGLFKPPFGFHSANGV